MDQATIANEVRRIGDTLPLVLDTIASLPRRIGQAASSRQASAVATALAVSRNNVDNYEHALARLNLEQVGPQLREQVYALIRQVNGARNALAKLPPIPRNLPVAAGAVVSPHGTPGWTAKDSVADTIPPPAGGGAAPKMRSRTPTLPGVGQGAVRPRSATPTLPGLGKPRSATPTLPGMGKWRSATPTKPGLGAPKKPRKPSGTFEALDELDGEAPTGWEIAERRLRSAAAGPGVAKAPQTSGAASSQDRLRRIAAVAAPAFAAALDTGADPDRIVALARANPAGFDVRRVRAAYVSAAAGHFASELAKLAAAAPAGAAGQLALGAVIAGTLAQVGRRLPVVPPGAAPAMSVLIHRRLQPHLPMLAQLASGSSSLGNTAPGRGHAKPAREMAW